MTDTINCDEYGNSDVLMLEALNSVAKYLLNKILSKYILFTLLE